MSTVDYYGYVPSPLPFSWLRGPPGITVLGHHIMMETKQAVVRLHNSVTLQLIDSFRGTATVYFYQTVLAIEKKLTTSTRTHFRTTTISGRRIVQLRYRPGTLSPGFWLSCSPSSPKLQPQDRVFTILCVFKFNFTG